MRSTSKHNRVSRRGGEMFRSSHRLFFLSILALALLFAACTGESPTIPPPGSGGSGGGQQPPPTAATIALSVSNASPVVSSTSTVTAQVSQGGNPVPDGTAVEFSTNLGTFLDTGQATTIRTTTNGVATATLTSADAGTATITARVNNVSANINVAFRSGTTPGPGAATITSITPETGSPEGNETVVIRGANLTGPVKVFFGDKEAFVLSATESEIQVVTPKIVLGSAEQFREVTVAVITRAGSATETRVEFATPFRYEIQILTPIINSLAPSAGPNEGNTRITIFGEAFQPPVRVFFGTGGGAGGALTNEVEAQVVTADFSQIVFMTPPATGFGSALKDQQVTMRVLNVNSAKDAVLDRAFRYGPDIQITAVGPTTLAAFGGTRVTIDGWGFDEPVAVSLAGVAAQPVSVTGTKIVVIAGRPRASCGGGGTGPAVVTNIEDGGTATSTATLGYLAPNTRISIAPNIGSPGGTLTVSVTDTTGNGRITIGGKIAAATLTSFNSETNEAEYSVTIPTNLTFDQQSCPAGGSRPLPTDFDVTFLDLDSGCTDTLNGALTVNPPATGKLLLNPGTLAFTTTVGTPTSQSFAIVNNGAGDLTVNSIVGSGAPFSISAPATPLILPACEGATVSVSYDPAAPGAQGGTVIVTSDGGNGTVTLSGNATAPAPAP